MIEYRPFHNSDPPQITELWEEAELGRGAVTGITSDAFEHFNFSQPYFDKRGLIVACNEGQIVGFAHGGFGIDDAQEKLNREVGTICAVVVHPDFRRQGIGRELVQQLETYLRDSGSKSIVAGSSKQNDPFFVGLYGGTRPAGFLDSDTKTAPFFAALGYETAEQFQIYQRDISEPKDPVNVRLVNIRRKMQLAVADQHDNPSWWWVTRFGRLDSARFLLTPKKNGSAVAGVTIVDLDLYTEKWQARAIGLIDLFVEEEERRNGYGQAILIDVCRRLRQELVTCIEIQAPAEDEAANAVIESAGFQVIDTGTVYRKA